MNAFQFQKALASANLKTHFKSQLMFSGEFLQARNSQSSCCIGDQAEKENALLQNQVRKINDWRASKD